MPVEKEDSKKNLRYNVFLLMMLSAIMLLSFVSSEVLPMEPLDRVRSYADGLRFNYVTWTLDALFNKAVSASLKAERFLSDAEQVELVETYVYQVAKVEDKEFALLQAYNPEDGVVKDKLLEKAKAELDRADVRLQQLSPLAEAVLQNQTERTLMSMGFGRFGQVFPPVLYQVSDLPLNLIVSPRDEITTVLSISLASGLDAVEKNAIEDKIFTQQNYSALIEEVGGVGAYPTMVMRVNNLNWLTETIAHEWIHNYLTLRPLGVRYFRDGVMRSINETTASLSGKEIGRKLIATYYPYRIIIGGYPFRGYTWVPNLDEVDYLRFDFRAEMHKTRVTVDALLELGKVNQAEAYMEMRRRFFWDAGYYIRKLNQAYFAFYGSYNDEPGGGASGQDPVGPAVRALRYSSSDLKSFIDKIQCVREFADLIKLLP